MLNLNVTLLDQEMALCAVPELIAEILAGLWLNYTPEDVSGVIEDWF